jgi:hypothetical protein
MQLTTIHPGSIVATVLGLLAAAIVWASLAGIPLPMLGERGALVALVIVGFAMCATSGWGSTGSIPSGPLSVIAAVSGILTLVVLGAVIFGWTALIDPVSGVFYGDQSVAADKVAVLMVGILLAISWLAATLRQIGAFGAATTG